MLLTPNPERAINAAFDSVNLINKLVLEEINENKKATVERNVKHLQLMLTKNFFIDALTPTQKTEIETCIAAGNLYII